MTETEQAFIDAFRRVDDVLIPPPAIRLSGLADGVPAGSGGRGGARIGAARLLMVAASLAVLAGIIVGVALWQPWAGRVPALPVATPSPASAPSVVLADVSWLVAEVAGEPVVASTTGEVPYLEFDGNQRTVLLGGPCPDLTAPYRQDGAQLQFILGDPALRCGSQEELAAQHERLWLALDGTRSAERRDGVLTLRDAGGKAVLVAHDGATYAGEPVETPTAAIPEPAVGGNP